MVSMVISAIIVVVDSVINMTRLFAIMLIVAGCCEQKEYPVYLEDSPSFIYNNKYAAYIRRDSTGKVDLILYMEIKDKYSIGDTIK